MYEIPTDVICQKIGDSAIIVDLQNEIYFELNATGRFIFEQLAAGKTEAEILNQVVGKFGIDRLIAQSDMNALIVDLLNHELIISHNDEKATINPSNTHPQL